MLSLALIDNEQQVSTDTQVLPPGQGCRAWAFFNPAKRWQQQLLQQQRLPFESAASSANAQSPGTLELQASLPLHKCQVAEQEWGE